MRAAEMYAVGSSATMPRPMSTKAPKGSMPTIRPVTTEPGRSSASSAVMASSCACLRDSSGHRRALGVGGEVRHGETHRLSHTGEHGNIPPRAGDPWGGDFLPGHPGSDAPKLEVEAQRRVAPQRRGL